MTRTQCFRSLSGTLVRAKAGIEPEPETCLTPAFDEAREFYAGVFGKTLDFTYADSAKFHFVNTIIDLEKELAAHDLDDADAAWAELAGRAGS